ncbi:uncharacterized protein LOC134198458 [Corticium candelabrum]|uniref:uncharacterized protein LOC134198458 n=1 Tax=Corticium candelabrum TaxID=121492 RepID=UPI002E275607|nr:uncharacterized protein LOC134198458 [Corticium candelabrum]
MSRVVFSLLLCLFICSLGHIGRAASVAKKREVENSLEKRHIADFIDTLHRCDNIQCEDDFGCIVQDDQIFCCPMVGAEPLFEVDLCSPQTAPPTEEGRAVHSNGCTTTVPASEECNEECGSNQYCRIKGGENRCCWMEMMSTRTQGIQVNRCSQTCDIPPNQNKVAEPKQEPTTEQPETPENVEPGTESLQSEITDMLNEEPPNVDEDSSSSQCPVNLPPSQQCNAHCGGDQYCRVTQFGPQCCRMTRIAFRVQSITSARCSETCDKIPDVQPAAPAANEEPTMTEGMETEAATPQSFTSEPYENTETPELFENTETPEPFENTEMPELFENTETPEPFENTETPEPFENTEIPADNQQNAVPSSIECPVSLPLAQRCNAHCGGDQYCRVTQLGAQCCRMSRISTRVQSITSTRCSESCDNIPAIQPAQPAAPNFPATEEPTEIFTTEFEPTEIIEENCEDLLQPLSCQYMVAMTTTRGRKNNRRSACSSKHFLRTLCRKTCGCPPLDMQ